MSKSQEEDSTNRGQSRWQASLCQAMHTLAPIQAAYDSEEKQNNMADALLQALAY